MEAVLEEEDKPCNTFLLYSSLYLSDSTDIQE